MALILAIESSCDDTSAAICRDGEILTNLVANQKVHENFGGVVPELASRAHQANIVPVVSEAIRLSGIHKNDIDAIAFTQGPGLMGSLLVGISFAKGFALANNLPLIAVNHMQAHVAANYIENKNLVFPFICLTVSGGHTQLVYVTDYLKMEIIGNTIDDAAGEAFDKAAKMFGLPYPGGPLVDKLAKEGNATAFKFNKPKLADLNYSFSGLKTSILYFLQKETAKNPAFIQEHLSDLCASVQTHIIDILIDKLEKALTLYPAKAIAIAGGVSANSGLRQKITQFGADKNLPVFIPAFQYCTDNAGMIGIVGHYKYLEGDFCDQNTLPLARFAF